MMTNEERREQRRFSISKEKDGKAVYLYEPYTMKEGIEGEIVDVGSGGFCVSVADTVIDRPLKKLDVIKAVIPISEKLPGVPTLGEVRWIISKGNGQKRHIIGMRFVI